MVTPFLDLVLVAEDKPTEFSCSIMPTEMICYHFYHHIMTIIASLSACRPGMTRLNFPYFMNEMAVKYIIEAVKMVAREGWKLLPQVCILIRVCVCVCVSHCHVCILYTM